MEDQTPPDPLPEVTASYMQGYPENISEHPVRIHLLTIVLKKIKECKETEPKESTQVKHLKVINSSPPKTPEKTLIPFASLRTSLYYRLKDDRKLYCYVLAENNPRPEKKLTDVRFRDILQHIIDYDLSSRGFTCEIIKEPYPNSAKSTPKVLWLSISWEEQPL